MILPWLTSSLVFICVCGANLPAEEKFQSAQERASRAALGTASELIRLHHFGGKEVLRTDELDISQPDAGEVLVSVRRKR
jgi:hypothetical protein